MRVNILKGRSLKAKRVLSDLGNEYVVMKKTILYRLKMSSSFKIQMSLANNETYSLAAETSNFKFLKRAFVSVEYNKHGEREYFIFVTVNVSGLENIRLSTQELSTQRFRQFSFTTIS